MEFSILLEELTWVSTAGANISAPIKAIVEGTIQPDLDKLPQAVNVNIEFSNYMVDEPDVFFFQPPDDIWCVGRQLKERLPKIPPFFSFKSELIFHWHVPEMPGLDLNVVVPRTVCLNLALLQLDPS